MYMMKNLKQFSAVLAVSTMLSSSALADKAFVAVGLNLSTTGIGAEARTPIADGFYGRIGANYFKYSRSFTDGEIKLKGDLTLLSAPIMLDWHPFDYSGFRLSAGVAYNGNKVKANGTAAQGARINNKYFTSAEVGSVTAELTLGNAIAGVASLGYDSSFVSNGPLSFHFELGAMYTGKPKLSVSSTGIGGDAFLKEYRKDADKSFKNIEKYLKFYPILKVGVKYAI